MQKSNDIQQNAAAISNPESESTTADKYQPLLEQIQPFTKVSFVDLPESLRERIGGRLAGDVWDLRSPSGRIEYARGYDICHDPARAIENRAGRWIPEMDADSWWSAESITPVHAAMLLSRFNPNEDKIEDAERTSSDEMGPEDFRRLKHIFEGASKANPRTLKDWLAYAGKHSLKVHSWIKDWEAGVNEKNARDTPIASSAVADHVIISDLANEFVNEKIATHTKEWDKKSAPKTLRRDLYKSCEQVEFIKRIKQMSDAGKITPRNPLTGLPPGPMSSMEKDWYLSLADAEKVRATMRMLDGSLSTATPPALPADAAQGTPTQPVKPIPGEIPSRANGKLAIEAAWSLEIELKRRPSRDDVMALLKVWATNGTKPNILKGTTKDQRGVVWITDKGKENNYDILALGKTLEKWMKSRN